MVWMQCTKYRHQRDCICLNVPVEVPCRSLFKNCRRQTPISVVIFLYVGISMCLLFYVERSLPFALENVCFDPVAAKCFGEKHRTQKHSFTIHFLPIRGIEEVALGVESDNSNSNTKKATNMFIPAKKKSWIRQMIAYLFYLTNSVIDDFFSARKC